MTTDDIYHDLYGVSPGVIAAVMGVLTLLTPYAILPSWLILGVLGYPSVYPEHDFMYSLLWAFDSRVGNAGLQSFVFFNPALLWATFPLSICNIIFALKVVKYYQGRASKDSVLRWACAALLIPVLALFVYMIEYLFNPTIVFGPYYGPIPIQIAVGLFILYHFHAPELVTPWTNPEKDESWFNEEEIEETCVGKLFITMEELDEIYKIED
ncbi:MAG: hypothetical protein ACFE9W_09700 [Promethearchaeota archaeon]